MGYAREPQILMYLLSIGSKEKSICGDYNILLLGLEKEGREQKGEFVSKTVMKREEGNKSLRAIIERLEESGN